MRKVSPELSASTSTYRHCLTTCYLLVRNGYQNAVVNEGTIILHSDASLIGRVSAIPTFSKSGFLVQKVVHSATLATNVQNMTGYKRAANGWIFATLVLQKDLMSVVNRQVIFMVIIILIIVIVGIVISTLISRGYRQTDRRNTNSI